MPPRQKPRRDLLDQNGLAATFLRVLNGRMRARRKLFVFAGIALLCVCGLLLVLLPGAPKYRAYVRLSVKPYTNGIVTAVMQYSPETRLHIKTGRSGLIQITIDSQTEAEARQEGEKVIEFVRKTAQQQYGAKVEVVDTFEDRLHPLTGAVASLNRMLDPLFRLFGLSP